MAIEYHLPSNWNDLNDWQMTMVSRILNKDLKESTRDVLLVFVFVLNTITIRNIFRLAWFLLNVSLIDVIPTLKFIHGQSTRTKFPEVLKYKKVVLYAPKPRLGNVTMDQFNHAVLWFNRYNSSKEPIDLIRLVSCLYTPSGIPFKKYNLDEISETVRNIDFDKLYSVYITFSGCLNMLALRHKRLFPRRKTKQQKTSYDRMMLDLSLVTNPFGNLEEIRKANIHDFFNHLDNQNRKK